MKITVTHQVLGGKVEKSVILDDPERTSLAPTAKSGAAIAAAPESSGYEFTTRADYIELSDGKRGRGAGKARKEVTNGK